MKVSKAVDLANPEGIESFSPALRLAAP